MEMGGKGERTKQYAMCDRRFGSGYSATDLMSRGHAVHAMPSKEHSEHIGFQQWRHFLSDAWKVLVWRLVLNHVENHVCTIA
jgi:hypothetical protein